MYGVQVSRFTSRDPIGYRDGHSLYRYVSSRPLIRIDPSGLACAAVCVSEKDAYGGWSVVDVVATTVLNFPSPSPSATVNMTTSQVQEVTCIYERTHSKTFRCMPCAFKPPKPFPGNTCTATCFENGTANQTLGTSLLVFADNVTISWAPSWWPPGLPGGISIDSWMFSSPADKAAAQRQCPKSPANVLNPMVSSFCAPSSFGAGCVTTCP